METLGASKGEGGLPMYAMTLSGEAASLIADLRSIENDLRFASRLFTRTAGTDPDDDGDLRRALYDAGTIAYRRGFTGGRSLVTKGASRSKVPDEVIKSLDADHQRAHEMVLERADKHIAHRVGDEEQGRVFLVLSNPRLERAVVGTSYFFVRFVGPYSNEVLLAAETANVIADSIAETVESVQSLVIESAKQQDLDSLYAKARPMGDEPAD